MNNYCINCGPSEPVETTQDGDDLCGCGRVLSAPLEIVRELEQQITALEQRVADLEAEWALCEPYLKENETPAMCIARNRTDVDQVLRMYADEMKKRDELEAAQTWIPVSERLPDESRPEVVFCLTDDTTVCFGKYAPEVERWYQAYVTAGDGFRTSAVRCWKPILPPAAQGEQQGGQGNE